MERSRKIKKFVKTFIKDNSSNKLLGLMESLHKNKKVYQAFMFMPGQGTTTTYNPKFYKGTVFDAKLSNRLTQFSTNCSVT